LSWRFASTRIVSTILNRLSGMFSRKKKGAEQQQPSSNKTSNERAGVNANGSNDNVSSSASNQSMSASSKSKGGLPAAAPSAAGAANTKSVVKGMSSMNINEAPTEQKDDSQVESQDRRTSNKPKHSISYAAERVIGNGSFGVVYQATAIETGETVAIKKVLQDRRFKNRELQIMRMLEHPSVVALKHSFLAKGEKPDDVYLNLVMEFIPETIHRTLRNHTKAKKLIPIMFTKVYMYQVCRALAYIHSVGICHRDIKPQNLLLDPNTHVVKLCDFGSAKILTKGQPNVAYICSRYYRAPELVFEATEYTTAIDIWSLGCVMAELLLGKPLFPGDSGVDQLIEIIKILGTPTKEEIYAMNPNHTSFSFPQISPQPWSKIFRNKAPKAAIDLVTKFLVFKPKERLDPFSALLHPFFDELREPGSRLPNGKPLPPLFNFTDKELRMAEQRKVTERLIPPHVIKDMLPHIGRVRAQMAREVAAAAQSHPQS